MGTKRRKILHCLYCLQSILLYSMVLSRWGRRSTYVRRDAGEEGGREFSSKMPRTMSNLPDFPCRPFLYAHLCFYTKSMHTLLIGLFQASHIFCDWVD